MWIMSNILIKKQKKFKTKHMSKRIDCGVFKNHSRLGPNSRSVLRLLLKVGLEKVISTPGERAIAPFAVRNPASRAQAISISARLPPAESPATNNSRTGAGPSGP